MVSFKFTSFFFMLMFVLQYSDANSQIPQAAGNDDIAGDLAPSRNPWAVEKVEAKNGNILGRKMMKRRVLMKEMENTREMSTTIWVAAHSVGNSCSRKGKQNLNADCKPSSRIATARHAARQLKYNSFVALNADYHPPKSHAPKNN